MVLRRDLPTSGQADAVLDGVEGDFVVILHLVRNLGGTGAGDRPEIVIPPVDAFAGFAIVGCPAEVGRINVGRQTLLEPVQLVGSDKMHFPRQTGMIARRPQMMRIGRDSGRELGRIVINAGSRWQLAAHERCPAGSAQGRSGIIVCESGRARGQRSQMRNMQEIRGSVREQRSIELIRHHDQDIWSARHEGSSGGAIETRAAKGSYF